MSLRNINSNKKRANEEIEYDAEETQRLQQTIKENLKQTTRELKLQWKRSLARNHNQQNMESFAIEYKIAMASNEYQCRYLILHARNCDTLYEGLQLIQATKQRFQLQQELAKRQLKHSQSQSRPSRAQLRPNSNSNSNTNASSHFADANQLQQLQQQIQKYDMCLRPYSVQLLDEHIWHIWCSSVDQKPAMLNESYSVLEYAKQCRIAFLDVMAMPVDECKRNNSRNTNGNDHEHERLQQNNGYASSSTSTATSCLKSALNDRMRTLSILLNKSLKSQTPNMHKIHLYILSNYYYTFFEDASLSLNNQTKQFAERILQKMFENIECLLYKWQANASANAKLKTNETQFLLFLLCWKFPQTYYPQIVIIAKQLLHIFEQSLLQEFTKLNRSDSPLLKIRLKHSIVRQNVFSNRDLLQSKYEKWYEPKQAIFEESLLTIVKEWNEWGLHFEQNTLKQLMKTGLIETNRKYISANDLILEFLHCVIDKIQPSFESIMSKIANTNNNHIVFERKSKFDEYFDVKYKYSQSSPQSPHCMKVFDFLKCKIVCGNDIELYQMYQLICAQFACNILKMKNLFTQQSQSSMSYYEYHDYYPDADTIRIGHSANNSNNSRHSNSSSGSGSGSSHTPALSPPQTPTTMANVGSNGCGMIVVHVIFGVDEDGNYFNAQLENVKLQQKQKRKRQRLQRNRQRQQKQQQQQQNAAADMDIAQEEDDEDEDEDEYEYECEFEVIVEIQLILESYFPIQQQLQIPQMILASNSDSLKYSIPANEILAERMCQL